MLSLQDEFAPNNRCFGCGPKNDKGLRIKSFVEGDKVIARFKPEPHHLAFEGMLNGGICGALLDCHSNWCATYHIMKKRGETTPPCTVTAEFTVKLLKPTPMDAELVIEAIATEVTEKKAFVDACIKANNEITATCKGIFVAVKEGHPAYHRW
jgi:acyl-coenzyme A thioesterase PaaI-like protein